MKRKQRKQCRMPSMARTADTVVKGATTIATIGVLGAMTTGVIGAIKK